MKTPETTEIHTVLGAGQVGLLLAKELARSGKKVRLVRRSALSAPLPGVNWLHGDITDPTFADEAARGATTIYNCMNPGRYHRWATDLPPLFDAALGCAKRAKAKLIALDNLYMIGRPSLAPFDESAAMNPCSQKGELRAQLARELISATERGDVRATMGRASDFFGPSTPSSAIFNPRFFSRLAGGKRLEVVGDPDQPHSYSYTPDLARALAVLGTHRHGLSQPVWHLPVAAQCSTRALISRFAEAAGVEPRLRIVSRGMLRFIGIFARQVSAAAEMVYQWELPYLANDSAFRQTFGVQPTELVDAVKVTLSANNGRPPQRAMPQIASASR